MRKFLTNKNVRKRCHIYRMLEKDSQQKRYSFHTPGHKNSKWDITELPFSDNLASPKGCILRAEQDVADILGAHTSFFLTDGSTHGVYSTLYAARENGVKNVAVFLPAHQSVYNGCRLLGLTMIGITVEEYTPFLLETSIPDGIKNADAILVTSPSYYGKVLPLKRIREYCDKTQKLLLIDGAHGGHLHYDKNLYAGSFAHLCVDGVHKSLPAFTQAAIVSAKTEKLAQSLKKAVDVFRTTSPSYPIMASIEYAVKYPQNKNLENRVKAFADTRDRVEVQEDYTKLCVLFGENAFSANAYFQSKGFYSEFCDGNRICFYLSPATKTSIFIKLEKIIDKAIGLFSYIPKIMGEDVPAPIKLHEDTPTEWVELGDSVGKISAGNVGLFPPCTPLLFVGEKITQEKINAVLKADNVFGVWQGKIFIVKEEKDER